MGSFITKWLLIHKYDLIWLKKCPSKNILKIACSALSGDQTAVTSVTNHSVFIKCP